MLFIAFVLFAILIVGWLAAPASKAPAAEPLAATVPDVFGEAAA